MGPSPLELTLVVAATARDMGIGAAGGLPWTGLRKEMAYFARVTKRGEGNAVIMGRRTWDSIPVKFRPLRGRLNVVISRSFAAGVAKEPEGGPEMGPVEASSLEAALDYLRGQPGSSRVFVIGGAQIYAAALNLAEARRVLLTRVTTDFDCDTHFPVVLGGTEGRETGWQRRSREEHSRWIGEEVPEGPQTESGTEYEFQMWERVD
ncbi:dihydrofolate reductase [Grosmannia clavigera kw1407]|uniref:Dihydrofolate reductase n=1 Tax=Grosmannia clavigera (strain kw1407 / UAMH 11150) TaxID=655863 RepID=F0XQ23_GROCL|nr:dihydrofolate reductase [Grosmannia clavigera kw1407]EFX00528.1 dihydrofolate reductase [Grosmannia clavigera kw1407]